MQKAPVRAAMKWCGRRTSFEPCGDPPDPAAAAEHQFDMPAAADAGASADLCWIELLQKALPLLRATCRPGLQSGHLLGRTAISPSAAPYPCPLKMGKALSGIPVAVGL